MLNPKETDERKHLNAILIKLKDSFEYIEQKITDYSHEILEIKRYLYENLAQFDSAEKAANRIAVTEHVIFGENALKERERLKKQMDSPYFGRIDFMEAIDTDGKVLYIGVYGFIDPVTSDHIIFDWRAPVSSMFYDFETGSASYMAPVGKIEGILTLKRQYQIRQGQMEYMIESALNIGDEILQKELSRTTDKKMKNIVATIQREQNKIIRNETTKVLIIQGAAGSGKTSVALHRVAFLLYHYKNILTSNNILILSPNKVFSSYISNVLPELGEENILQTGIEDIAANIIDKKYQFQTFSEQVENLLEDENADTISRIEFKATNQFVEQLHSFLEYTDKNYFHPTGIKLGDFSVSRDKLLSDYNTLKNLPVKKRLRKIADDFIKRYKQVNNKKINSTITHQIRNSILKMFKFSDAISLYQDFYHHINRCELFQFANKNKLEFCDVYPFIYIKMYFEGVEQDYKNIHYLIIDEMQDYTPVQYAVLAKLFSCKMTILGDSFQSVNPYSSSTTEKIKPYFDGADCMELCASYRSTIEITNFSKKILNNEKMIPMERHGEMPTVSLCSSEYEQLGKINDLMEDFKQSEYTSLGIICKSQQDAKHLFEQICTVHKDVILSDFDSSEFQSGVMITSVHMSKGLEFDCVIIPNTSDVYYKTPLDKSLLYIACTRALHRLDLTYCGGKTDLPNWLRG